MDLLSLLFQLRPSANVYDLAKNFNLEVSLFERLVKVDFPFVCLKYQVRKSYKISIAFVFRLFEVCSTLKFIFLFRAA